MKRMLFISILVLNLFACDKESQEISPNSGFHLKASIEQDHNGRSGSYDAKIKIKLFENNDGNYGQHIKVVMPDTFIMVINDLDSNNKIDLSKHYDSSDGFYSVEGVYYYTIENLDNTSINNIKNIQISLNHKGDYFKVNIDSLPKFIDATTHYNDNFDPLVDSLNIEWKNVFAITELKTYSSARFIDSSLNSTCNSLDDTQAIDDEIFFYTIASEKIVSDCFKNNLNDINEIYTNLSLVQKTNNLPYEYYSIEDFTSFNVELTQSYNWSLTTEYQH